MTSRKLMRQVFYSLETTLVSAMEKIATPALKKKYIGKAAHDANRLVLIVTLSISFIYVSWIIIPLVTALLPLQTGKIDRNDESLNAAMYLMWTPQNYTEYPKLELVLAFKCSTIFFGVLIFATTIVLILVVCSYLTSYFKLLSQCIQDIEELYPEKQKSVEGKNNDMNEDTKNNGQAELKVDILASNVKTLETRDDLIDILQREESVDEKRYTYLRECTIFHQILLE
ncbi:hypothetical protein L9F63_018380 [Diploptera punctata]|uniref:Odorant receptor n=1 Tax=Diploptera punctata TaxID=6984 RepID=A0AAD7ZWZ7_DIPPU|nr:hypothetical protein L9F63_018380 [Diploptera punctata]